MTGSRVRQPTNAEIAAWWKWAAAFSDVNSPFQIGIGNEFDRVPQPNFASVICLTCTAGHGGRDTTKRSLNAAIQSGFPILVPVLISCDYSLVGSHKDSSSLLNGALKSLGTIDSSGNSTEPEVIFMVDDQPETPFFIQQEIDGITFAPNNLFEVPAGNYDLVTAGNWGMISPPVKKIEFGGKGGVISKADSNPFETYVIYEAS
jgi:hypothetical protein